MKHIIGFLLLLAFSDAFSCKCSALPPVTSKEDLKVYDFIALVNVVDDDLAAENVTTGRLRIQITELFKGKPLTEIFERAKNTSCDLGIDAGEEWIFYAKLTDGKMSVGACDRNEIYRTKNGMRDWKYGVGMNDLKILRKIYEHEDETPKSEEFYPGGQRESKKSYQNGKLNGEYKIWYPDGKLFLQQMYVNDTLQGKSEWFYPSGQSMQTDYFEDGKLVNITRVYYDSTNLTDFLLPPFEDNRALNFSKLQVQYEVIYNKDHQNIMKVYSRFGKLISEEISDFVNDKQTSVYYHENGMIAGINYKKQFRTWRSEEYSKEGDLIRISLFDEVGQLINKK